MVKVNLFGSRGLIKLTHFTLLDLNLDSDYMLFFLNPSNHRFTN